MKWINIGEGIKYDLYELRCQLYQENHLQIFLEEDLLSGPEFPHLSDGILLEMLDSHLKKIVQKIHPVPIHHYQVQGINFGIDVLTVAIPIIKKI